MNIHKTVDFNALVSDRLKLTGADIKAICTEAGMFAIRDEQTCVTQEHFRKAIQKVKERSSEGSGPSNFYC